jgi:hypothetical protein
MNEKDHIVAVLTGFSMDKLLNTVDLIEAVVGKGGMRHGDRLALEFCKQHRLPKIGVMELMSCLGTATNRKMLLMNPDEGDQEKPSIIH